jgi:hypothetical protein
MAAAHSPPGDQGCQPGRQAGVACHLAAAGRRGRVEPGQGGSLWSSLKGVELANLAGDTLNDVIAAAERGIHRIRAPTTWPTRSCGTAA